MDAIRRNCRPSRRVALAASAAALTGLFTARAHAQAPPLVRLPRPAMPPVSLQDALAQRRSLRSYAQGALTLPQLSALLWAAQGVTAAGGLRTAPSAGAIHPLDLYLHASRVEGLAPGVHRYDAAAHALALVHAGADAHALASAAGGQRAAAEAPLVVAITSVTARTAAKYGDRAARYVAFESGAASQNLALAAVALGLGCVVLGAFDDRAIARVLRLPPGSDPVVLMPVGLR